VGDAPSVSILIPAYESQLTIARTLDSLRGQTLKPLEVVVVDSSPVDSTEEVVRARFPETLYHHSPMRMLPHAARNHAAEISHGELIACIDPDAVAHPEWLQSLVAIQRERGGAVSGAVACFGRGWIRTGTHLTKFDKWLPGGEVRRTDIGPTVSLLLSRADLLRAGGWEAEYMIGDTLLSWRLAQLGIPLWFAPGAIVEHDHTDSWSGLLREMYARGREFGQVRRAVNQWGPARVLMMTALSLLPVRLIKILLRVFSNSVRAGMPGSFLITLPIIASGHAARLAGEVVGYFRPAPD
jgi:GT2 family glycosyltransferase